MKDAIFDKGKVNDIVVLDNVTFGKENIFAKYKKLAKYEQPAFFTIVAAVQLSTEDEKFMSYTLRDSQGIEFDVRQPDSGWLLVEVNNWAKNKEECYKDSIYNEQVKINKLSHQNEILKEILIKQGIRIVSQAQAKDLGIDIKT